LTARLLNELPGNPFRTGRHVEHDPRSVNYPARVGPLSALRSVDHELRIAILNQADLGSCVGNAWTYSLGFDSSARRGFTRVNDRPLDEPFAVVVYDLATHLDDVPGEHPPDDTGSTGIGGAKAVQQLAPDLLRGYTHAFAFAAVGTALLDTAVPIGIPWYNSMFEPHADGGVPVVPSSGLAGGHEVCLGRLEVVTGTDRSRDRYWFPNSWDTSWGVQGWGFFTAKDLATLLRNDGDATVPVWATAPQPELSAQQLWDKLKVTASQAGLQ
jgi:hypothetical protein